MVKKYKVAKAQEKVKEGILKTIFNVYKNAYSGLPRDVWLLSVVILVNRSGSIVLFFMTLYLTKSLGFSIAAAGQMVSIYGAGSILGAYLGGILTDRIGAKMIQLLSLILSGIGFVILGYLTSPLEIMVLMFLTAVVNEAFRPANATALSNVCPAELRARGFGLNRLAINLGVAIGPAVGGFLARIDYLYLFWADAITCMFAAGFLWYFFRDSQFEAKSELQQTAIPVRSPWRDGIYIFFAILILGSGLMFSQLFNTWPVYMRDVYLLLEDKIGLLMALNAFFIVLVEMPLIHRIEAIHPLRVIAVGVLFLFGGFAIMPLGSGMAYGAFTVIIWTIGEMLVFPLAISFVANRASDQNRGKYMGLFTITHGLAFVLGPIIGTGIYDAWGPTTLWFFFGVLGILSCIGFLIVERQLNREKVLLEQG